MIDTLKLIFLPTVSHVKKFPKHSCFFIARRKCPTFLKICSVIFLVKIPENFTEFFVKGCN
jgi:hypothetical protein